MEIADAENHYDLFISYATEDIEFATDMAERLRENGAAVWFDQWEIRPGDNIARKINDGISGSLKMLAIWSKNYWADQKAWTLLETFAATAGDPLSADRPLIPVLIDDSESDILPLYRPLKMIHFQKKDDFHLHFNDLVNALDLARPFQSERDSGFSDHADPFFAPDKRRIDSFRRGKTAHEKGDAFEREMAQIYRLKGFEVIHPFHEGGFKFDLKLKKKEMGFQTDAVVECKNKRVTARDRDQISAQKLYLQANHPPWQCMVVSSIGFAGDTRTALKNMGVSCQTYNEALNELFPLEQYVKSETERYERMIQEKWDGHDRFIRPDIEIDISWKTAPALEHITGWFRDGARNLLVLLGDLGTGKTTLSEFLAWKLGLAFLDDPSRNPAPVLIPLGNLRKDVSLESLVITHFSSRNIKDVQFSHFQRLLKMGKIILLYDAFDEMADKVDWEITRSNFYELSRAATYKSKVLLTCRSHYFKDRQEQNDLLKPSDYDDAIETDIYQSLRGQPNSQVVYLKTFSDDQIMEYLRKHSANPDQDWMSIKRIYNLQRLAHRPLLLEMIVTSLPRLDSDKLVNAASLYKVYTDIWIKRDEDKGRYFLSKDEKREIMKHLALTLWKENRTTFHHEELIPLCRPCVEKRNPDRREKAIQLMVGEIRAATFIKRANIKETDGDGEFRFMHRSFMEYFFALHLFDIIEKNETASIEDILKTRPMDQKIIYFFSQIDTKNVATDLLQNILVSPYKEMVSENALRILYWSGRVEGGMEQKVTDHKRLHDILEKKLPKNIQLQNARLDDEDFEGMVFKNSDLSHAILTSSNFRHSNIIGSNFAGADFTSASFQDSFLSKNDFAGTIGTQAAFLNATLHGNRGMDELSRHPSVPALRPSLQLGHSGGTNCAAVSPDGTLVASCDDNGLIIILRASDLKILSVFQGHTGGVHSIVFSPDGASLASAGTDGTARIWDVPSGKTRLILTGHENWVKSAHYSPNGRSIVTGSDDETARIWNAATGQTRLVLRGHKSSVNSTQYSPDGLSIVTASDDETARIWDVATGKTRVVLTGHEDWVTSAQFSPDGRSIVTTSSDKTARIWDAVTGQTKLILTGHENRMNSAQFSPDGFSIITASRESIVSIWDATTGKTKYVLTGHENAVNSAQYSPNGRFIVTASDDNTARIWDASRGQTKLILAGHESSVNSAQYSPNGRSIVTASNNQTARIWDAPTVKTKIVFTGHNDPVNSAQYSPDGLSIVTSSWGDTARIWEATTGKTKLVLTGHKNSVHSAQYSPSGRSIVTASYDETIRIWNTATGKTKLVLTGHEDPVHSAQYSPDGRSIVTASWGDTARIWDATTGKTKLVLTGHKNSVDSAQYSPDGRSIVTASLDNTARIWDVSTGKTIVVLTGHENSVNSAQYSPDGLSVTTVSYDTTVRIWDAATGKELQRMDGFEGRVSAAIFSPSGKTIIAGGSRGRLEYRDAATGKALLYRVSFGENMSLAYTPEGLFDGDPEAIKLLYFWEPGTTNLYAASDLRKDFHNPEAISDILNEKF